MKETWEHWREYKRFLRIVEDARGAAEDNVGKF